MKDRLISLLIFFTLTGMGYGTGTNGGSSGPSTSVSSYPDSNVILTIKAVGDIVPCSDFPAGKFSRPAGYDSLFDPVAPLLSGGDLTLCNFEGPITTTQGCAKKIRPGHPVFAFRYPPKITESMLRRAGFNLAHIANNHILDFGTTGMDDTIRNFNAAGIDCAGVRGQILYRNINGLKVAVIGFNYFGWLFNDVHEIPADVQLVSQARTNADIVVITMHAGAEGETALHVKGVEEKAFGEQRGNVRVFARKMIDAGADCVIGFSPHVLRGMEMYKGKVIAYSLGNFLGYGGALRSDGIRKNSVILELKIRMNGRFVSGRIIPVTMGPTCIPGPDDGRKAPIKMINDLSVADFPSSEMKITPEGELIKSP
jgi:poly-gamma-glutamate capsule biosynthesis protein CapA/YwtB (metallophosphatase superfamily)